MHTARNSTIERFIQGSNIHHSDIFLGTIARAIAIDNPLKNLYII
jgi:hypothetical protein